MDSYEAHLVQDILAAGDLTAIDNLIQALFEELGAKVKGIRNPRRLSWLRHVRACLAQVGELPAPPVESEGKKSGSADTVEVDLCAKHVVSSGDLGAVEILLNTIGAELNLTAVMEVDPARRRWMSDAGNILNGCVAEDSSAEPDDTYGHSTGGEIPFAAFEAHRGVTRVFAILLLILAGLAMATGLLAALTVYQTGSS